jgi:hypothetical protein
MRYEQVYPQKLVGRGTAWVDRNALSWLYLLSLASNLTQSFQSL